MLHCTIGRKIIASPSEETETHRNTRNVMKTSLVLFAFTLIVVALHAEQTNAVSNLTANKAVPTAKNPPGTNAPATVKRYEPKYYLKPMTTEALAERHMLIGWEIKKRKK